jgi:thioredoxin reductase/NAD-dependent dihydropyrimidine dehydrogenase PreA subunit
MHSTEHLETLVYALPLALTLGLYWRRRSAEERRSRAVLRAAVAAGRTEPVSRHPVIDPTRCVGCGSCIKACPEGEVLGLINDTAHLVNPASCIGHGTCRDACPVDAITHVFGTASRGVDVPLITDAFETTRPGIFIAGELAGMGLIRNAIEQGRRAIESIRRLDGIGAGSLLDVVIVGAGPAGFSASLAALEHGLRAVTLEQDSLGGAVAHYPRGKIVMTAPAHLPLFGKVHLRETTKEALLAFWEQVERQTGVVINYRERMESVERAGEGFVVRTPRAAYSCRAIVLAVGRRGSPRTLEVPGEELPKVVYRLVEPAQYRGQRVLVVGGGNSALEAAVTLSREPGTTTALSYRGGASFRGTDENRRQVDAAAASGRLDVLLHSTVSRITPASVHLVQDGREVELPNDAVIVCAGGTLPTAVLRRLGIAVETKFGTP